MAERRRSSQSKRGGGRQSPPQRKASGARGTSSASRTSASRAGQRTRQQRARRQAGRTARAATAPAERGAELSAKSVAEFREALRRNLIRPLDLLMLSRDRIEEVVNEAVERGRMTADDAQELAAGLIQRGRKQTNDVLKDMEQLLGRSRDEIEGRSSDARRTGTDAARRARRQVEAATGRARTRAAKAADPALVQADRIRRAAGVGRSFPISGYEDLTAAQVQGRLGGLTPAELRKVRDYERRHANRKSVLSAIEGRLS